MPYRIYFDPEKCVACGTCAIACADQCDWQVGEFPLFRRVLTREAVTREGIQISFLSVGCMHCTDAACVSVCPRECFSRDQETGLVRLDNQNCIGCGLCKKRCPIDAIGFRPDGKSSKCNGCAERLRLGLRPACEKACQNGAIRFAYVEDTAGGSNMKNVMALAKLLKGH